jgi:tetratricopeptide (TPR) repeat protein
MIITSTNNGKDGKQAEAPPQFTAAPPQANPLAATAPIAVTKRTEGITIDLVNELAHDDLVRGSGTINDRMVGRSERELARRPNSARAHTNLGVALLNAGDMESAQREFEAALAINPAHYVAAMNLARIRVEQQRFADAEAIYSRLAIDHPKDPTPVLSLAFIAIRKEQDDVAAKLLGEAIKLGHKAITAKHLLGMVLLKLGRNQEAISTLRSAAHLEVREPTLYEALGVAYSVSSNFRRAVVAFKTALQLSPGSQYAVHGLSRALLALKKTDEAVDLLVGYLENQPRDKEARQLLAKAYGTRQQHRSAIAQLMQVWSDLEKNESDDLLLRAQIANNIGAYYMDNREAQQAESWFLKSIAIAPDLSSIPYCNLAKIYVRNKQIPKAFDALELARPRFPNDPDVLLAFSGCLDKIGAFNDAIAQIKPIYESGNATPEIYAELGGLLSDAKGDYDSALRVLEEAYAKFPDNPSVANNLAYLYAVTGDVKAARPILELQIQALEKDLLNPSRVSLTATWGLLRIGEGDLDEGARFYKKAEKLALQFGNKELAHAVVQKMHLELARAYIRVRDYEAAREHVQRGQVIHDGRLTYEQHLNELGKHLLSLPGSVAP